MNITENFDRLEQQVLALVESKETDVRIIRDLFCKLEDHKTDYVIGRHYNMMQRAYGALDVVRKHLMIQCEKTFIESTMILRQHLTYNNG